MSERARVVDLRAVPSRPSDDEVLTSAVAGEIWALEALYRRHATAAFSLARRLLGSNEDVDDVVQDTFVTALGKVASLRDPAAFRSWLMRIVVGKVSRVIRKRRLLTSLGLRSREEPDIDHVIAPSAPPEVSIELKQIYRAVTTMPAAVRIAFLLRRVEGQTLEEVAESTQCSLATVKRRMARAEEILSIANAEVES